MAFNVPNYDSKRFSFGPGIVYLGAPGTTPVIDVGAVKGDAELNIERNALEMKQGSPQTLVKSYTVEENVSIKFTSVEWNLTNLAYALGAGVTSQSGADEILGFGGDPDKSNRALRYVHKQPDGSTIDIQLFKVEGAGSIAISLKEADFHEFPVEFKVLEATLNFQNATPSTNQKKFKIIRTVAA